MKDKRNLDDMNIQVSNNFIDESIFDDKIDEWHNSDSKISLHEYLGLTEEEYKIWLKNPEEIKKNINKI